MAKCLLQMIDKRIARAGERDVVLFWQFHIMSTLSITMAGTKLF